MVLSVLDAHRLSKRSMSEIMSNEKFEENIKRYALYRIDLQWGVLVIKNKITLW